MTDLEDLIARGTELAEKARRAAPGEWTADLVESDDGYGRCKAAAVYSWPPDQPATGRVVVDTHNSETAEMHQDDGPRWDANGQDVCEFIAWAHENVPALLDRLRKAQALAEAGEMLREAEKLGTDAERVKAWERFEARLASFRGRG